MSKKKSSTKNAEKDDVLSLFDSSSEDAEFSGFETVESAANSPPKHPKRPKVKSVVTTVYKRTLPNETSVSGRTSGKSKSDNVINLDNLTREDILKLKNVLGLENEGNYVESGMETGAELTGGLDLPTNLDLFASENESDSQSHEFSVDDSTDVWRIPKLKTPEKGEPINDSLARLVNTACTNQCNTNEIVGKLKIPSNCEYIGAPKINEEIWGDLAKMKRTMTTDKALKDIQEMVYSGMLPVLNLAKVLKSKSPDIGKPRELISNALTLIGQVQFMISVRRRYLLRPSLKSKYYKICSINTPITSQLFGDDISKELKKCETNLTVGNFVPYYKSNWSRGHSDFGPMRGGRGRGFRARGSLYSRPAAFDRSGYGQFGRQHIFPQKQGKKATATVTSEGPN